MRPAWPPSTSVPFDGEDALQVWCALLDRTDEELNLFSTWLSGEERDRVERAASEVLRRRFIARRGLARLLVGRALEREPGALRFRFGAEGKPELEGGGRLALSLSHSGPLALLALSLDRRVGVDVEAVGPRRNVEGVIRRAFSPEEAGALLNWPRDHRLEAFYRVWTRKEALAKGMGMGIASSFQRFSVTPGASGGSSVQAMDIPGESARAWTLVDLEPAPGFLGALAVEHGADLLPTLRSFPAPGDPEAVAMGP